MNKKTPLIKKIAFLASIIIFSSVNTAFGQSVNKLVEFRDIFGNALSQTYFEQFAIRYKPMPNHFSSQYYLRTGLADSECVSFQSKLDSEKYLMVDEQQLGAPKAMIEAVPTDFGTATFCKKDDGFLYYKKNTEHYQYILVRWFLSEPVQTNGFRADDRLSLATIDYNDADPFSRFIPVKYREVQENIDFVDSYSISPAMGTFNLNERGYLSEDEEGNLSVRTHNFVTRAKDKPGESNWFIHKVGEGYFSIQHTSSTKYLVTVNNRVSLETYDNVQTERFELHNSFYHTINDNALWKLEVVNEQGEHLIYNKETGDALVLTVEKASTNDHSLVMQEVDPLDIEPGMLHNITERFIYLKKLPEDITAQNSIVHLSNGLPRKGIYTLGRYQEDNWLTLNHKIFIDDLYSEIKYHFVQHVGPDPDAVTWSFDRTRANTISLEKLVKSLPALKDQNTATRDKVVLSVKEQLKGAFGAVGANSVTLGAGYTPTILWLSAQEDIPDGVSQTLVDSSGKWLRVVTNGSIDNTKVFGYGFLLQRTEKNGNITFTIDDPDPVTNEER